MSSKIILSLLFVVVALPTLVCASEPLGVSNPTALKIGRARVLHDSKQLFLSADKTHFFVQDDTTPISREQAEQALKSASFFDKVGAPDYITTILAAYDQAQKGSS